MGLDRTGSAQEKTPHRGEGLNSVVIVSVV